jgi:seryl-tRNA synthetase
MLTLRTIQENPESVIRKLAKKRFDAREIVNSIVALTGEKNQIQVKADKARAEMNQVAKEIGQLIREGKNHEAARAKERSSELKENIRALEQDFAGLEEKIAELVILLPNLPHESVPEGKNAEENLVVRSGGSMPVLETNALPHWELAARYNLIDFELGVKLTGAGFPVYRGKGARLQRALINFFLDMARRNGYEEIQPPLMVNEASGFGTGQLPDKEGQMYHVTPDHFYMIPTAEVPVTNIYRDVILDASELPVKNCAYSACFRREAGSYGKEVRGLNRLHQFDKVEIVEIANPDHSYQVLEEMVAYVEKLVQALELPYRIVKLCGGDMGFTSALTYDFEVWSAAQQKWLEVSSVSNFESFQANRLKLRFRDGAGNKPMLAHTLNGSALALPRIVAALLENNQNPQGINIPQALIPWCGFDRIG